jgi:hypothetical protein
MTRNKDWKWLVVWMAAWAALLMPVPVGAATTPWLDEITALVIDHRNLAMTEGKERVYEPYLAQLAMVWADVTAGSTDRAYTHMNRFMDMLQNQEGGIPGWSAKTIFDLCGAVTPVNLHDAGRHVPTMAKDGFDYWIDDVFDPGSNG